MAPDFEINWDLISKKRASLEEEINALRRAIREKQSEISKLPSRGRGRPEGTILRKEDIRHTRYATIAAYDMIQKWRYIETKRGQIFDKPNRLPPKLLRDRIIAKACEKWPLASSEEVRNKIDRINVDAENRSVSGGLLYRVRTREFFERSDDFLDV